MHISGQICTGGATSVDSPQELSLSPLDQLGLSLLDASNKSEWHNITDQRRLLLARYPRYLPKLPPNGPLPPLSPKGLYHHAQLVPRYRRQHANLSPGET
jgi:hypothetical protein